MLVKTKIACTILLYCYAIQLSAQKTSYPFSRIDISQGLSHNRITCIHKDHKGFMWFGTIAGLNRYDGYVFKVFTHDTQDSLSLADNYIEHIYELPGERLFIQSRDVSSIYNPATEEFTPANSFLIQYGLPAWPVNCIIKTGESFWFLYANGALYKLDDKGKVVHINTNYKKASQLNESSITNITAGATNNVLAVFANGTVESINSATNKIVFYTESIQKQLENHNYSFSVYADRQNDIWLYVPTMPVGAFYYNSAANRAEKLSKENGRLNNNIISGIVQDDRGRIWIGTDHGGVNLVNKTNLAVDYLKNREDDNTTLSQNVITTLYYDNGGIIWLGTYKRGINYYNENITRFPLYKHLLSDKNSLSYDDVNRFVEDDSGNLWIGTNGGGLLYFDRKKNKFTEYKHDSSDINTISNDVIVSLWIDHEKKLWIGSYFGGLDCFDGKNFIHYRHDDKNPGSLTEDRVWEIYEDKDLNLWVGTFSGGLDRFNRAKKVFYHYPKGPNSVSSNYISCFAEDAQGNLWVGSDAGIDVLQKQTAKFVHFSTANSALINNDIISLLHDKDNNIWIGSRNGLCVFNAKKAGFQCFTTQDGLPDNSILNIIQDNAGKIWVSTPDGLSKITFTNIDDAIKIKCKNYDEMDGLQSRDFNENAAYKTRAGELVFGGAKGFNIFDPASLKENKYVPPVVFTDFQLFNKSLSVGEQVKKHIILPEAIAETKKITLNYNENVFSIEFAALSFDNTEKDKYEFKLEGFDKQWLTANAKTRRATYTNLDAGEYVFRVKASNDNELWNNAGASVLITVLPPFWKTTPAYITYALLFMGALFLARKAVINRTHARFALEQERKEAHRLHALDMLKIKFFTNVSHEFRTPLSLILTPLDKIIRNTNEPEQKKQLQLIKRNGKRMLNLVNQLLDFRKIEVQELKLNLQQGNVARFIRDISFSFTDIAETKHIQFNYTSNKENCIALFDTGKLERILFNLLSNAFKFTPEKGSISVNIAFTVKDSIVNTEIKVIDTGIGIPPEKYEKIFDRFFQDELPDTILNQGSGIGLAITREFVRLYGGAITVESEVDKGSCFTVVLPLKEVTEVANCTGIKLLEDEDDEVLDGSNNGALKTHAAKNKTTQKKRPVVLLVEDNEDFLFYLKDNLNEFYHVADATDGKKGWQKVLSEHPDIVVSDVSMPVMDGITLCKKIKADPRTRHIPVIFLTAMADEQAHVTGLETGASDYITKPFNFEIMLSRIRNILMEQKNLKKAYNKQVEIKSPVVEVQTQDEKFMQHVLEIVEKNLSNPGFSVEALSRELYMSRVAVYKKIFILTGKSPIDFIRSIRLERAAQLLYKSDMSIAEVAYEVGFNNPKYFSKFFKAEFNIVPSEYAHKKKMQVQE
ncbi:MAG TPA: two-component regulator propeller domain-containing protein [Chitinophagaceae bacterium]|nr:two-component regulator propeller domain-containing protein [Chitinophagaceae bacterium]